jgi:glyceraldehyde 3-phosphate dehydrogenase
LEGELVEQIKYSTNNELVSSDVGTSAPSIYDSNATIVSNDGKISCYTWYDNEYGYSHQVIRLAKYI